ncbi:type II toxin-antitoxin system PemK/MazF family toxin [Deinococcus altitudinis]|uniref:type II toxin-antitoxin system PemK/MazF family toxin n=1 Tax=Deinococcus altitudinis TaxID=468914 RepID=UPI00389162FF
MTARVLELGSVFVAEFPEHDPSGREQQGLRPAVVVGLPTNAGPPRFPVLLLAPVTTYRTQDWVTAAPDLYPVLSAGTASLTAGSVVLIDQTRALDASRVRRFLGTLTGEQYAPIHEGLRLICDC